MVTDPAPAEGGRAAPGQAVDLPLDSHLHTDFSHDSRAPLELYAAQAAQRGIREIAITDHVDFLPGAPGYESFDFGARERTIRDAAERSSNQLVWLEEIPSDRPLTSLAD